VAKFHIQVKKKKMEVQNDTNGFFKENLSQVITLQGKTKFEVAIIRQ